MGILNIEFYSIAILLILILDYISKFKNKFTIASKMWLIIAIGSLLISVSNIFLSISTIYIIKLLSIIIYLISTIICSLSIYAYIKYIYIGPNISVKKELIHAFIYIALCTIFTLVYTFFITNNYVMNSFDRHYFKSLLLIALIPNIYIFINYIYSVIRKKKAFNIKLVATLFLTIVGLIIDIKSDSLYFVAATYTLTALIIYISKHEELLFKDPLTGLFNKRMLNLFINRIKPGTNVAVYNMDINNFKIINDTHGHHKGDLVLKSFAKILKDSTRERDLIIRNGGDEFLVIAYVRNKENALKIINRINNNLDKYNSNAKIKFTISIGWDIYKSNEPSLKDFNNFLNGIDKKMYEEKEIAHKK